MSTLLELAQGDRFILAAEVGGAIRELTTQAPEAEGVRWITRNDLDGERIYQRGLSFLFYLAMKELAPEVDFQIYHSLSQGLYLETEPAGFLNAETINSLTEIMKRLVSEARPFIKIETTIPEAQMIYRQEDLDFKANILPYKHQKLVTMYSCKGYHHYFYGYMVPDTSYLYDFELTAVPPGLILRHPTVSHPYGVPDYVAQSKTHRVHMQSEFFGQQAGVRDVVDLNALALKKKANELIREAEADHSRKIRDIAETILAGDKRIILISGPSSSGKTTFSRRLMCALRELGSSPKAISIDDYFVNREFTPRDESGDYDFESIEAIDLDRLQKDINQLLTVGECELPRYDFVSGTRQVGEVMKLSAHEPIILEGIHALNPNFTKALPPELLFRVYVSALTALNLDLHNRIPTTDNRLIRRIIRDERTRGYPAEETIRRWPSVRRGEDLAIFPYQEQADMIFNSSLVYELAVLQPKAISLLEKVPASSEVQAQVKRLKKFLYYFVPIKDTQIPVDSILREFIGGGNLGL